MSKETTAVQGAPGSSGKMVPAPKMTQEEYLVVSRRVQERIITAIVEFFDNYPLYYTMLCQMPRLMVQQVGTIGVGFMKGQNVIALFMNPLYLDKCSDLKLRVLLAHELLHIGLFHILRLENRNRMIANYAADMIVNNSIPEYKLMTPEEQDGITVDVRYPASHPTQAGQLVFPDVQGLDVRESSMEEIYEILMKKHDKALEELKKAIEQGRLNPDNHDNWDGQNGQQQVDANGQPIDVSSSLSPEQVAAVETLMKEAVDRLDGRDPGKVPGALRRLVEEIRKPKTDWRRAMNIFAQTVAKDDKESSWKRYNRRVGTSAAGHKRQYRPRIVVAVDNSGSIDGPLYNLFMSQVLAISMICQEVKIIGVDTAVNAESTIVNGKIPTDWDLKSGGGTEFQPAFDYAKAGKYDGIIYLTDGYGPAPINNYRIPALFAICPNGHDVPGYRNIKIEE